MDASEVIWFEHIDCNTKRAVPIYVAISNVFTEIHIIIAASTAIPLWPLERVTCLGSTDLIGSHD